MVYTGDFEEWGAYFIYALLYCKTRAGSISGSFTMYEFDKETSVIDFTLVILFFVKNI
ncbi:unknown [Roseburia sp. CAG:182]|nr:unknown [Roseburia sp. CAG:182]